MDRNDVAAVLGRRPDCKSVDRAMAAVDQGHDLVAVWEGGDDANLDRVRREFPHASRIVVLAHGIARAGDRIGVFVERGKAEPSLF